eukprot:scaffold301_cov243-Pinguiococcus_pyrenoidosus.AAC.7
MHRGRSRPASVHRELRLDEGLCPDVCPRRVARVALLQLEPLHALISTFLGADVRLAQRLRRHQGPQTGRQGLCRGHFSEAVAYRKNREPRRCYAGLQQAVEDRQAASHRQRCQVLPVLGANVEVVACQLIPKWRVLGQLVKQRGPDGLSAVGKLVLGLLEPREKVALHFHRCGAVLLFFSSLGFGLWRGGSAELEYR